VLSFVCKADLNCFAPIVFRERGMTKHHKNRHRQGKPLPSAAVQSSAVSKELPSAVKASTASIARPSDANLTAPAKPKTLVAKVKSWAWRLTAGYSWLHTLLILISGHDPLSGIETAVAMKAVTLLSFLGFAPVNAGHLPLVFLATWLLTIAAFSPVQVLIGLPLYVLVFPFTV